MPSGIDVFPEQREAMEQLHGQLAEIFVEHRVLTMTPAERRQFDALMKLDVRKSGRPAPQNPRNQNREKD